MERLRDTVMIRIVMETAGREREESASPQIANIENQQFGGNSRNWLRLG